MNKHRVFLRNTFRLVKDDEILIMLLLGPLFMGVLFKFGGLYLARWLLAQYAFDLAVYYPFIDGFLFLMGGMIYGMLIAFMIIDELDEGIIHYYKITPFGGRGYLRYRFLLPLFLLFVLYIIISIFFTLQQYSILQLGIMWVFGALQMYFSGMLVIAFANNKLESLVVSKMIGMLLLPFVLTIIDSPYVYLFSMFPSMFLGLGVLHGDSYLYFVFIGIAIVLTLVLILLLKKRFLEKLYKTMD